MPIDPARRLTQLITRRTIQREAFKQKLIMHRYEFWNRRAARNSSALSQRPRDRSGLAACLAVGAVLAGATVAVAADPPAGSVAVYTDAQAADGRQIYYRTCANCHGEDLAGKVGPALTGRQFHQMVAAQKMTAALLFQFIATRMPQAKPGSLTPEQYAEIMAFILQRNGYPSGSTPLTVDSHDLGKIDLASAPKGSG
jgi:mono/diheme cytochrome c family protein